MEFDREQRYGHLDHEEQELYNESAIVPYDEFPELLDKVSGIYRGYLDFNPTEIPVASDRQTLMQKRERALKVAGTTLKQLQHETGFSLASEIEDWLKSQN